MSAPFEPEVLTEVPPVLKRLVRFIIRGFYGVEHAIVIDMLVRNPCMKEEDLMELLKFEQKQLRSILNKLKMEKFLKQRMRVETDKEGKTTKHNYYFINFKMFVNVVKYKLDHMRRKIETEERDATNRASFTCPECSKSYTDLEADQLFDFVTQTFNCTLCQVEVHEDVSAKPQIDARTFLAQFNEQIEPIYAMLRECDDFKLAPELLEPEPTDMRRILKSAGAYAESSKKSGPGENTTWSGDASKERTYGFNENTVTISMGDESKKSTLDVRPKKEQPIWMSQSTVDGAVSESVFQKTSQPGTSKSKAEAGAAENKEILQALLVHEKKTAPSVHVPGGSDEESSSSESEDEAKTGAAIVETMETDEEEDEVAMVTIGSQKVPYAEVTNEIVAKMTLDEKAAYIKLGQEIYANMYE